MAIDWGSVLTGAVAGFAGSGFNPIGAAVGAGAGIINGIFGKGEDAPTYQKYSDPYTNSVISKLMNSKLGQTAAAHTAGELRAQSRDQMEQLSNNPNLSGNTSALAALNNRLQRQAETGIAGANIAGAQQDQNAMEAGAQLQNQQNQFSLQRNNFEQDRYKTNQQPTFMQDLFGKGVNAVIGGALGRAGATNGTGNGAGLTAPPPPDSSSQPIPSIFPPAGQSTSIINAAGSAGSTEESPMSGGFNLAPTLQQPQGDFNSDFLRNIRSQSMGYQQPSWMQ